MTEHGAPDAPDAPDDAHHHSGHGLPPAVIDTAMALKMTVGRGAVARLVADLAGVGEGDRVVDVGCGPGTAARGAARRGAGVIGVDPSRAALRLGRTLSLVGRARGARFVSGTAESLPLPSASATVLWALLSVHHWHGRARGLAEARRVLAPSGRLLLVERDLERDRHGRAGHGLTDAQSAELVQAVREAGFADAAVLHRQARERHFVVVTAAAPSAG